MTCWICYVDMTVSSEIHTLTGQHDLMSVVTICLGKPDSENYTGILKFLDVLLSSSRAATEKKKILEEEFGVAMSDELERESCK